ncbi:MAG: MFS transporter [Chloroflexota bacterium]|nr:MFS transporter [Chloroflexota bacterium]
MDNKTVLHPKLSTFGRVLTAVSALQHRNYRLYFFGLLISVTGFQMLLVIQGWLVWDITGDPSSLAFLGGVTAAPTIILNLLGGVVADRFNQRYLIMIVQGVIGLLLFALATLVYLDTAGLLVLKLWHILLLSFLIAGTQSFDNPARQALYPHLINRKDLMNAVALNSVIWQLTRVIGPVLAGALIATAGAEIALYIAAGTFGCMVIAMIAINVPPIERAKAGNVLRSIGEGIGFVVHNHIFAFLIGMTFLNSFFGMSYIILLPIYATDILDVGPEGLGNMHAVGGIGAVAIIAIAAALSKSQRKGFYLIAGAMVFGISIILFAYSTNYYLSLLMLFVGGAAATFYMVLTQTTLQALVPDNIRGRVFSIYSLTWSLLPLGAFQAGLIADWINPQFAIALGGSIVALVALIVILTSHQVRTMGAATQQALEPSKP